MRTRKSKKTTLVLGIFVFVAFFSFLLQKNQILINNVNAADLTKFDPGNIISDYVMGNYNSMSESEIQAFLNSKINCNHPVSSELYYMNNLDDETYGYGNLKFHVKNGYFVCLANEKFGNGIDIGEGETAAHIIWQAAQDYKINPQVIIVLLQKEQGLITDNIPNNIQYRSATGYGCPDTAACNEKYYGFKNQVRNAAALFRTVLNGGWTNYPLGNNYIQYSPNSSCGGSIVNIQNLATSALYRYTPYQPNAGTLAAGYGTAYCGAYGNRNFYLYFNDWFGNSTFDGWSDLPSTKAMTVKTATAVIDAKNKTITQEWAYNGESFYFDSVTNIEWGNTVQECWRRKNDSDTNKCILTARLDSFDLEKDATTLTDNVEYKVIQSTCSIELLTQYVNCLEKKQLGDNIVATHIATIDGNKMVLNISQSNTDAYLEKRLQRIYDFKKIDDTLLRVTDNTNKINVKTKEKVMSIDSEIYKIIKMSDTIDIDGVQYYRTKNDSLKNAEIAISSEKLSENIFDDFKIPRNLTIKSNTTMINIVNENKCQDISIGQTFYFSKKLEYNGKIYYGFNDVDSTKCVVESDALAESDFNFNNIKLEYVNFQNPRKLRLGEDTYSINLVNGTTCDKLYKKGQQEMFTTKIMINQTIFYRTENSSDNCAIPAFKLEEL